MPFTPEITLWGQAFHREDTASRIKQVPAAARFYRDFSQSASGVSYTHGIGDQIVWYTELVNNGELNGTDITVVVQIPAGLGIDEAQLSHGTYQVNGATNEVTWSLPVVAPGETYRAHVFTTIAAIPDDGLFRSTATVLGFPGVDDDGWVDISIGEMPMLIMPMTVLDPDGPIPTVTGAPNVEVFAGTQVCWLENFANQGTNPGFGPYILLVLAPGLTLDSSTFIGSGITPFWSAEPVVGTSFADPITTEPVTVPAGSNAYAMRYPVGSVVTGGPALNMNLCVTVASDAEIGEPNPIDVYGGYEFGNSALGAEGPLLNTDPNQGQITPILVTFAKTNNTPENERPPGPIWTYEYTLQIELAPGQTLDNVVFEDALDADWQFTGIVSTGGACTPAGEVQTLPSTTTPGGTLRVAYSSITNSDLANTCLFSVVFQGYITDILSTIGGDDIDDIHNEATFTYEWEGEDPETLDDENHVSAENMVFQKSVTPTLVSPGDIVTYTIESQITQYGAMDSIRLVDTMPDGIEYIGSAMVTAPGIGSWPLTLVDGVDIVDGPDNSKVLTFNIDHATPFPSGTTVSLTYQGRVLQMYRAPGLGDVRANDELDNSVIGHFTAVNGAVYQNNSGASVVVEQVTLTKETISSPANGVGYTHGEPVTFRIRMDIPSGDAQHVTIHDFFPLPVFDVNSTVYGFGAIASGPYTSNTISAGASDCASCGIVLNNSANLSTHYPISITPVVAENSLQIAFPPISTTGNAVLEMEITMAVVANPFADGLYLSNIAQAAYANTPQLSLTAESIAYLGLSAPDLLLIKGVAATSNVSSALVPSADATTTHINNNLENADGSDVVTYVITVENTGGAPAFNVRVTDSLETGMPVYLTGCVIDSVLNGNGDPLATTGSLFPFGTGVLNLSAPLPGRPDDTPAQIAESTAYITYTCTIDPTLIDPHTVINNSALVQFDSRPVGGITYPVLERHSNPASVTLRGGEIQKSSTPSSGTIGDLITYTVVATFGGGTYENVTITDALPPGVEFVAFTSSTSEAGLSSTIGFSLANAPTGGPNGPLVWSYGDVTSTSTQDDNRKTLTLTYVARIMNVPANVTGVTLVNTATLAYTGGSVNDTSTVTVIEPVITIAKSVSPTVIDALDEVTYTLVVTNTSTVTAYDVVVTDRVPVGLTYTSGSLGAVGAPGAVEDDSADPDLVVTYASIAPGQSSTITFRASLNTLHYTGGSITNIGHVVWTSQDCNPGDPDCVERTGTPPDPDVCAPVPSGTLNDYNACDSAEITIADPTIVKTVTSTPANAGGYTMGELVTYSLLYTFPEGTTYNAILRDQLPVLAANGTPVSVAYVSHTFASIGANLQIGGNPVASASFTFTTIDSNSDSHPDRLRWAPAAPGHIVNVGVNEPDDTLSQIRINVTARVTNHASNVGVTPNRDLALENVAALDFTIGPAGDPSTVQDEAAIDLVEPRLQITKMNSVTTPRDAGATVTYTLTISHHADSTAAAHDIIISDALPAVLSAPSLSVSSTCTARPGWVSPVYTAPNVTFQFGTLPLAASCTIVYTATITDAATANTTYTNTAQITTYSTRPGPDPDERIEPPLTPVTSMFTTIAPTVAKTVIATDNPDTTGANLAIGETVTYQIRYTMPEGVTRNVQLIDQLPPIHTLGQAVLQYIDSTLTIPASMTTGVAQPIAPVVTNGHVDAFNDTVTYTLGNVTNPSNNVANDDDVIVLVVRARVVNIPGNVGRVTGQDINAVNRGRLTYSPGATGTATTDINSTANVSLVEPQLTITKGNNASAPVVAGNTVTYTLTIGHHGESLAPAYNVRITDLLPHNTLSDVVVDISSTTFGGTCAARTGWSVDTSASPTLAFGFDTLPLGTSCTIVYTVTVADSIRTSASYDNTARITSYTTMPTDPGNPQIRVEPEVGPVTSRITTPDPQIDKVVTSTTNPDTTGINLAIGESVTYTVFYTLPHGTTRNVRLVDSLPPVHTSGEAVLEYVSSTLTIPAAMSPNTASSMVVSNVHSDIYNDTVTYTLGDVTNPAGNPNSVIIMTVTARVVNIPENVGHATGQDVAATNRGRLIYQPGATGTTDVEIDDTADVNLVEPRLTITKSNDATGDVEAGDTVTYTLTIGHHSESLAPAYNVRITDLLPNNTPSAAVVGAPTFSGTCPTGPGWFTDVAMLPTVTFGFDTLALGSSCTVVYTVTVADNAYTSSSYDNTARITSYTTMPTDPSNTQIRTEPEVGPVTSTITTPDPSVVKTEISTPAHANGYSIGETVRYRIVYTFPAGTTRDTVLIDQLPRTDTEGAVLQVTAAQITAQAGLTPALTGAILNGVLSDSATDSDTLNDTATWTLGDLVFTDTSATPNNSITVEITAVVVDVADNVGLVTNRDLNLTNTGILRYRDRENTLHEEDDTEDIDLAEPQIQMTKSVVPAANTVEIGDDVTYTLTVSHTGQSTSDAYNIVIADTLPVTLGAPTLVAADSTCDAQVGWNAVFAAPVYTFSFDTLALGTSCTIVYRAEVLSTAAYGTTYTNSARINSYESRPTDGREYGPTPPVTADFTPETGSITKAVTGSNVTQTTPDNVLTIGEVVTYTVTVTLPTGTRENVTVTDDLPTGTIALAFVNSETILLSAGANLTLSTPVGAQASVSGTTATWTLGTVVNSGASAAPAASQLVFQVRAIVLDAAVNVGLVTGQVLDQINTAELDYTTPVTQGATPIEYDDTAAVSLVEPEIVLAKSASTATDTVEPGDTVTYTLTISHTDESTADAHNIVIRDVLPTEGANPAVVFDDINSTLTTCGVVTANLSAAPTLTFSFNTLTLAADTCNIVYTAIVTADVLMDTTYVNLARVNSYTTTPNSPTTPENRTEDPSPEDDGEFTTGTGGIDKVVSATDNPVTGNVPVPQLTIGEVVTYTITATLPIGVRNNVTIEDVLPTNVVFDVLEARLTTVGSGITPTSILNTNATETATSLTWSLGTLTNASATPNTATSQLVFTVRLRVLDDPANVGLDVAGRDISAVNDAFLRYNTPDGTPVEYDDDAEVGLVEPQLVLDKDADLDTALIGDTVSYTVVVTHTAVSTTSAFDLVITDPLVAGLDLVVGSVTATSSGSGVVAITSGNNAGDTTIRVTLTELELSSSLIINYQAVIASSVNVNDDLVNVASVTGESTPCLGATPCPGRPTDDDDDHEVAITPPTMTKAIVDTSLADTTSAAYDPSIVDATIGERVTYEVEAYIQEGSYVLRIVDPMPDVLEVISSEIVTIGANISGSLLSVGDAGAHTDANSDGFNDTVTFEFGTITNINDNVRDAGDLVVVRMVVRVRDVPANADGQTKTNVVTIHYGASTETAQVTLEIVEPRVELAKAFSEDIIAVNEPFSMTLTLTNTGNATAYDLSLLDPFNPYLELLSMPVLDMSGAPNSTLTGNATMLGLGANIHYMFDQLRVGETITLTAEVRISIHISPSPLTIVNVATVTSDTIPSGHPDDPFGRETTTQGVDEVIGAHPTLDVVKVSHADAVPAGAIINYTITVTNTGDPAVNSNGIVVTDTLPQYTSFISVSTDMGTCAQATVTTVVCDILQLQPGERVTIRISVRTSPGTPDGYIAVNTVTVTTDEGLEITTTARTRIYRPEEVGAVCSVGCPQVSVYHTNRDGNWEIYRLGDIAGQPNAPQNLTRSGATDYAPSLSPDGNWFAFASDRDGNWEIYIAPTNGQVELTRRVTHNTIAIDTDPVWGPNNVLVYESTRDGNWELYAFDLETGVETRLTDNAGSDINPFWSSDGTRIVFQSDRSGQWQLYELTLQTANLRLISDGSTQDVDASFNPAGTRVAFRTMGEDGSSVIHLMNRDGSGRRAISDTDGNASNAVWSPDGSLIAYQSDLDGDLDIYVYQVSSGQTRKLTDNDVPDFAPTWLCDTTTILWTSEETGNPDIFSASALGITAPPISALESAEHLVDDPADDVYPESAPVEENASQEGYLPNPVADNAVHPSFINPGLLVTPIDRTLQGPQWGALGLCEGIGVLFPREEFDRSLYPVR